MARLQTSILLLLLALAFYFLTKYKLKNTFVQNGIDQQEDARASSKFKSPRRQNEVPNRKEKQQRLSKEHERIPALGSVNTIKGMEASIGVDDSGFTQCHPRNMQDLEPRVLEQIQNLADEQISHDDPQLANLIRENFIDQPVASTLNLNRPICRTLQTEAVDKLLKNKVRNMQIQKSF